MYFLTVSLCMPSSRAIPRMDSPLRFAFCTAFHLAVRSGVGFLDRGVAVLRTLAAPLRFSNAPVSLSDPKTSVHSSKGRLAATRMEPRS